MNWPLSSTSRNRRLELGDQRGELRLDVNERDLFHDLTHSSGAEPAECQVRREEHDACHDGVVHVAEVVVGVRVGGSERPARPAEPEAEDSAAGHGQRQEPPEGHAHDPGRDGDERTRERAWRGRAAPPSRRNGRTSARPGRASRRRRGCTGRSGAAAAARRGRRSTSRRPRRGRCPRAGRDDREVAPRVRVHVVPKTWTADPGEGAAGDGAGVEHDQLARDGHDGREHHQPEDGVDAVVADRVGQRSGEAGEHGGDPNDVPMKGAASETVPIEFSAATCTW